MRLIDADALHKTLSVKQKWVVHCGDKHNEGYTSDQVHFAIDDAPTVDPVRHGTWVKMSDADGIYYACSECGEELPRVVISFNPQFDLFPKLKCIDKTAYCPNCGCKMDR